tara:strand:- start:381 stop:698 length:318 start_codon:yes stop_codon:yes gene_type:complete
MDSKTKNNLILNIDSAIEQLQSVKSTLENTAKEVKRLKKPVRKLVNDPTKTNTYRIEELCTTGWVLVDSKLTNLAKEDARNRIKNLIDNEAYNPDDLRVVVDGQV